MGTCFYNWLLAVGFVLLATTFISHGDDHTEVSRGLVICTGEGDILLETLALLEHLRRSKKTSTKLPIVVAHCAELSEQSEKLLLRVANVSVLDLCKDKSNGVGSNDAKFFNSLRSKVAGFFCKPAALLASPFQETMLVDSDVVWFMQPDLLFDSLGFKTTGSLFFRDRWTETKNKHTLTKGQHNAHDLYNYIKAMAAKFASSQHRRQLQSRLNLNAITSAAERSALQRSSEANENKALSGKHHTPSHMHHHHQNHNNNHHQRHNQHPHSLGLMNATASNIEPSLATPNPVSKGDHLDKFYLASKNAFWRHFATGNGKTMDHMQESSVVLMDRKKMSKTLEAIRFILPEFRIGYGDKEIYWIAALIADEEVAFEPHVAGSLGDCGAIIHFDPRGITRHSKPSNKSESEAVAEPFYINAEYLLDLKKITKAGEFLSPKDTVLVTSPIAMNESTTSLFVLHPWKNMKHGFYPCGNCIHSNCKPAQEALIHEIITRQRLILELRNIKDTLDADPSRINTALDSII